MCEELAGRRVLDELAAAHHGDAIPELDRLVDVVRDEEHGRPLVALDAKEFVLKAIADDRVDRAERFIHEHHRRLRGESSRDADALALAAGELRWIPPSEPRWLETDEREQLLGPPCDALLRPPEQSRHGSDVVRDGLMREEPDLLDDVADAASQGGRLLAKHVLPIDEDGSAGRLDEPVDHLQRGRLARAAGADEDADLSGGDLERQLVDGQLSLVALGDVAELHRRAARARHHWRI